MGKCYYCPEELPANGECKSCKNTRTRAFRKTKKGVIGQIYSKQLQTSRKRGHPAPTYTLDELREWCMSQETFHLLFDNWKILNYQSNYKPSIDRKDDYLGYSISNIQVMTWKENADKYHKDSCTGINTKANKAVLQYTKDGELVSEYFSSAEAGRVTGIPSPNITSVCKKYKHNKSAGGFIWRFKDE